MVNEKTQFAESVLLEYFCDIPSLIRPMQLLCKYCCFGKWPLPGVVL